jgi:hypothetical protein
MRFLQELQRVTRQRLDDKPRHVADGKSYWVADVGGKGL